MSGELDLLDEALDKMNRADTLFSEAVRAVARAHRRAIIADPLPKDGDRSEIAASAGGGEGDECICKFEHPPTYNCPHHGFMKFRKTTPAQPSPAAEGGDEELGLSEYIAKRRAGTSCPVHPPGKCWCDNEEILWADLRTATARNRELERERDDLAGRALPAGEGEYVCFTRGRFDEMVREKAVDEAEAARLRKAVEAVSRRIAHVEFPVDTGMHLEAKNELHALSIILTAALQPADPGEGWRYDPDTDEFVKGAERRHAKSFAEFKAAFKAADPRAKAQVDDLPAKDWNEFKAAPAQTWEGGGSDKTRDDRGPDIAEPARGEDSPVSALLGDESKGMGDG